MRRVLRFLALIIVNAQFAFSSPIQGQPEQILTNQEESQQTPILISPLEGINTADVAEEILKNDPDAIVLAPESQIQNIVKHRPNTLNTILMLIPFAYGNRVYLTIPTYTWLQSLSTLTFNTTLLTNLSFRLDRYSRILNAGGKIFSKSISKLRIVDQEKWQESLETAGSMLTVASINYFVYSALHLFSQLPDWKRALLSVEGQEHIMALSAVSVVSGVFWGLRQKDIDKLPENQRPISRQGFSTFTTLRMAIIGFFVPGIVAAKGQLSLTEFLLRSAPLYISAGIGLKFYLGGDEFILRNPKLAKAIHGFDSLMLQIDKTITEKSKRLAKAIGSSVSEFCLNYLDAVGTSFLP